VRPILETCQPRNDLRTGAFNPEIFTAVLSQVLEYYRGNTNVTQNIYTDAEAFFTEATYPTQGMQSVLSDVFGRLAGDNSLPAIHRLDLTDLALPGGGTLRLSLNNVPPESMRRLGELCEVLAGITQAGEATEGYLEITNPGEACPFIRELHK
jgi:hypothetical protein